MNESLDNAQKTKNFLQNMLRNRSPWIEGKEKEFQLVVDTLQSMIVEWYDRERFFRKENFD